MTHSFRYAITAFLALVLTLLPKLTQAHSVGQVQTSKFLAPQTIQMLQARIAGGGAAGFQVGDVITYIIQFVPVPNGANTGVAGFITDYIPAGTEVVGAAFVRPDGLGGYTNVAPNLPGGIDFGWGNRGQKTFLAPFNVNTYDPTGRCAAGGFTNRCNARLTELHADTGIFYSTDARTAVFPAAPATILQSANGYRIAPTAQNQLNPLLGQNIDTTHNLWDADQTNAFGTGDQGTINALPAPKSAALYLGNGGTGATPYFAGSVVAGPQSGYQLDNTGAVGPWQRIAYPGSRIGDPTTGPATAADTSFTAVGGLPTSAGVSLSTSAPLPATTNALRWAAGKLQVGQTNFVSISLRLTAPPVGGCTNQAEVFGGDAAEADNGQDNVWRYNVPSVAVGSCELFILKTACQFDATASVCVPVQGSVYPDGAGVTYQITYINTSAQTNTNVVIRDQLPCVTPNGATVRVGAETGPMPLTVPFTTVTSVAGNCGSVPQVRQVITFPTIASLAPGESGNLIITVPVNAAADDLVVNSAAIRSTQLPNGVTSTSAVTIGANNLPAFGLLKTTPTANSLPGGTAQYVVTLRNVGTGPATGIQFDDFLPTLGGAVDPTRRFNFANLVSVASAGFTTSTALVIATTTANVTTAPIPTLLAPYSTDPGAANRVRVNFNFGATSALAVGGVITLTFNVNIGTNMPISPPSYTNDVVARAGTTLRADANAAAPINLMLMANLAITKTNGTDTVAAGQTVVYTIVASNGGPSAANSSILRDPAVTGLNCTQVSCTPSGGAVCPVPLDISSLQNAGLVISTFPSGSSINLQLTCGVAATGIP